MSPLMYAARTNKGELIKLLVNAGAHKDKQDNRGYTVCINWAKILLETFNVTVTTIIPILIVRPTNRFETWSFQTNDLKIYTFCFLIWRY